MTNLKFLIIAVATFFLGNNVSGQMSGNYTIDPAAAASTTNFTSWTTFAAAWNAASITGPVTVSVKANSNIGLNAITLNANGGSSATNTLTIDGNTTTLTYTGANAALRLNGTDYVIVNNMTIENSNASTPGGVWITNQADFNDFNGVNIFLSGYNGTSSATYYYAVSTSLTSAMSNGSLATGTTGQPGSYNRIRNCTMYTQSGGSGPYTAVGLNGNTANYTTVAQNNSVEGCVIRNFYYYAVFMQYPNGNQVLNNDISRVNATSGGSTTLYAIYENYPNASSRDNLVNGNNIHDLPFVGATTSTTNLSTFYGIALNYPTGNASYEVIADGNLIKNVAYLTGSRYVFPKLDPEMYPIADDRRFVLDFLRAERVLVVQGTGFNWPRPDHLRIVTLPWAKDLTEAIDRLGNFLSTYQPPKD